MSYEFDSERSPLRDDELPDEDDYFDDDEAELVDCPACGAEIYEEAEQCPVCGEYVLHDNNYVWSGRPAWWIVLGAAGIFTVIVVLTIFV